MALGALDGAIDVVNSVGFLRGNTWRALQCSTTVQVHRLSESLFLVDDFSVQFVSTSLALRLPQKS